MPVPGCFDYHALTKLNQIESESLNRQITPGEIDTIIKKKKTLNKPSPGPDGFRGEFYQTFQGELTLLLLKPFHKIQA